MAARPAPHGAADVTSRVLASLLNVENADSGVADIPEFPLSSDLTNLVANWGVEMDTTGTVKAALIIAMKQADGQPLRIEGNITDPITFVTSTDARGGDTVGSSNNMGMIEANVKGHFLRNVISAIPAARTWLIDLCAANQIRTLTHKNIEGYFMAKNATKINGRELVLVVSLFAKALPKIMADEGARDRVLHEAGDWLKYHTTATSTAALCAKMMESIRGPFPTLISDATAAFIQEANDNRWDKERADLIPRNVVAITYIWLEVSKQLPDEWFQGNKAISEMNPSVAKMFRTLFKRYLDIAGNTDTIGAIGSIRELQEFQNSVNAMRDL